MASVPQAQPMPQQATKAGDRGPSQNDANQGRSRIFVSEPAFDRSAPSITHTAASPLFDDAELGEEQLPTAPLSLRCASADDLESGVHGCWSST